MSIIIPANSAVGGGFNVANSIRFDDSSSSYLQKSASGGNRRTFTFSTWVKRSILGGGSSGYNTFFSSDQATANSFRLTFSSNGSDDKIMTYFYTGSQQMQLITNRVFRDPSAWYHIVVAVDTTQGTASNRTKLYVNGVQETSFSTETYPSQNLEMSVNQSGAPNRVGAGTSLYFDGYMAETVLLDGTAASPTSFGEFDEDSGIWKPISVSGLTFGTNGFHLNYETAAELGTDANGGTTLSETNLTAVDQSLDTCTNNFATLNPLYKQDGVFSQGNLNYTISASDFDSGLSTFAPSSGKWYFESKITALGGGTTRNSFGICDERSAHFYSESELGNNSSQTGDSVGYDGIGSGNVIKNGSSQYTNGGYGSNDILCCAVDLDNGAYYVRKNGDAWANSGNPESGSSRTGEVTIATGEEYVFGNTAYNGSAFAMNFGSPAFAISSGNQDEDGFGNFEYAVPSGYFALCTKNLAEYG